MNQPICNVEIKKFDSGYAIIEMSGRFIPGGDPDIADVIKSSIRNLVAEGIIKIVVDLHHVDYFASNVIGALVDGKMATESVDGSIILYRPKKYLRDSLKMVKIDVIIRIVDDLDEALDMLDIPRVDE